MTEMTNKTKEAEWNERSKIRDGELEAIAMAKKILSKVTGVRNPDTHEIPTKALLESTARVEQDTANSEASLSFLQVVDPKAKAVNLLRRSAVALHNKALERLAQQISTYDGPFDKIKAMIQKMIFHLMGEQKDEDEHKLWCDMETEKKLREENHAEIVATIKDAADAQAAITEAIAVLKDFYKESGMIAKEPWEFLQTGSRDVELPEKPSTWDSSYTGTADPKSGADGILTILDETMQKFSKMEADAKVADETDQK